MDQHEFLENLKELTVYAATQENVLTKDEIQGYFSDLTPAQYELMYQFLTDREIRIRDYVRPRQGFGGARDEKPAEQPTNDEEGGGTEESFLAMYREEMAAIPELNEVEEDDLFEAFTVGNKKAKDMLIESQLAAVFDAAMEFTDRGVRLADLVQEGNVGLMMGLDMARTKALESDDWDWRRTMNTIIMDTLSNCVTAENDNQHLEERSVAEMEELKRGYDKLRGELGRKPNVTELADFLMMEEDALKDLLSLSSEALELAHDHSEEEEHEEGQEHAEGQEHEEGHGEHDDGENTPQA